MGNWRPTGTVVVLPYDPAWPAAFAALADRVWPAVADLALELVHVGSTAVPGLAAKPIIDADLVIESYEVFPEIVARLAGLGYTHEGDLGIPSREVFGHRLDDLMDHHLYVCPQDSAELARHLGLRDHLRHHDADRDRYARLKLALAARYRHDVEAYTQAKTGLIEELLMMAGVAT